MRRTVVASLALAMIVVGVVSAHASLQRVRSTVTISSITSYLNPDRHFILGYVNSPRAACSVGRAVRVFRREPGDDVLVGTDRTDEGRNFSIENDGIAPSGDYYAQMRRKRRPRLGIVCKADTSPDENVI